MRAIVGPEDEEPAPDPDSALDESWTRLVGLRAVLVASDPWELADPDGQNRFHAVIRAVEPWKDGAPPALLLHLEQPSSWKGRSYSHLVASARYADEWDTGALLGRGVACNAIGVLGQAAAGDPPWGAGRWRGGLTLLGHLTIPRDRWTPVSTTARARLQGRRR